jgi:hypothetical protein
MIVYVGGDGHAAAAAAASPYLKANNDSELFYLGTVPHPANLAVSWLNGADGHAFWVRHLLNYTLTNGLV